MHMQILHYTFQPRIKNHLTIFIESWNAHPLSTERNKTPLQLWVLGSASYFPIQEDALNNFDLHGIDWSAPLRNDTDVSVEVPAINENSVINDILISIDPLKHSDDFGVNIFIEALELVKLFL